ncbi:hypothetical protein B566_EDAN001226 [Ephemera danica]|nr:hypothetical protein B566_EDAN001226 [Ephemera danica]
MLGSKRKPGDVASNLAFPPPQPKVAKPSTVASATVTSATVTSGNSSNHIASATPLSINNSQPEAETTATKLKRLQAHTQLSQDFSKMMSRQLGLASDEAARYKPKIALFDDILEDSSEKECCICIASAREVAFVPCGHTVCCSACSARLNDCPVCRKKIKTKLTLYFS